MFGIRLMTPILRLRQGRDKDAGDEKKAKARAEEHRPDVAPCDLPEYHWDARGSARPHALGPVLGEPSFGEPRLVFDTSHVDVAVRDVESQGALVHVELVVHVEPVRKRQLVEEQVLGRQLLVVWQPVLRRIVAMQVLVEPLHRPRETVHVNHRRPRLEIIGERVDRGEILRVRDLLRPALHRVSRLSSRCHSGGRR